MNSGKRMESRLWEIAVGNNCVKKRSPMNDGNAKAAAQPPSALQVLEQLDKMLKSRITVTSPQQRVKVSSVESKFSVRIRPEGFQTLDPAVLGEEVVHAYKGVMRAQNDAERKLLANHLKDKKQPKKPNEKDVRRRELFKIAREDIHVRVTSPAGWVTGIWNGSGDIRLKISPVNDSYRADMESDLSIVLNELAEEYRAAMAQVRREVEHTLKEARKDLAASTNVSIPVRCRVSSPSMSPVAVRAQVVSCSARDIPVKSISAIRAGRTGPGCCRRHCSEVFRSRQIC